MGEGGVGVGEFGGEGEYLVLELGVDEYGDDDDEELGLVGFVWYDFLWILLVGEGVD